MKAGDSGKLHSFLSSKDDKELIFLSEYKVGYILFHQILPLPHNAIGKETSRKQITIRLGGTIFLCLKFDEYVIDYCVYLCIWYYLCISCGTRNFKICSFVCACSSKELRRVLLLDKYFKRKLGYFEADESFALFVNTDKS